MAKVDLDEAILKELSEKQRDAKIKKTDWQVKSVSTAFVKAATSMAQLADLAATAKPSADIRQAVADKAVESIHILTYGAALVHPIRRNNVSRDWPLTFATG